MNTFESRKIRILKKEYLWNLYIAVFGFIVKTIQIIVFFDKDTGLIKNTFGANLLGFFSAISFWALVALNMKITIEVTPVVSKLKPRKNRVIGLSFFLTGFLFFLQGIMHIARDLADYRKNVALLLAQMSVEKLSFSQKLSEMFPLIADVMAIVSAVAFFILGIVYIVDYENANFTLLLIPVLWGAISLVSMLLSLSKLVSMVTDGMKIGIAVLALLFLYYTVSFLSSYGNQEKRFLSVFVRVSFPTFCLIGVLPYINAFCFGKKDILVNSPYYCYLGLLLFSIPFSLEYYFQTVYYIIRKEQRKTIQ